MKFDPKVILGIFDLLCILPLFWIDSMGFVFPLLCGLYLLIKGGVFLFDGNYVSGIDVIIGIYILILFGGVGHIVVSIIAGLYLAQKGIVSLFF